MSHFDYENAKRDIRDAGGDPDYLSHYNEAERDRYLKGMGLNPSDYGGGRQASGDRSRASGNVYDSSNYTWSSSGSTRLSKRRQPLKKDRKAREIEEYMRKTPDEIERESLILKAISIIFALFLIFFGFIQGF